MRSLTAALDLAEECVRQRLLARPVQATEELLNECEIQERYRKVACKIGRMSYPRKSRDIEISILLPSGKH
jgi:hypothetical protein